MKLSEQLAIIAKEVKEEKDWRVGVHEFLVKNKRGLVSILTKIPKFLTVFGVFLVAKGISQKSAATAKSGFEKIAISFIFKGSVTNVSKALVEFLEDVPNVGSIIMNIGFGVIDVQMGISLLKAASNVERLLELLKKLAKMANVDVSSTGTK